MNDAEVIAVLRHESGARVEEERAPAPHSNGEGTEVGGEMATITPVRSEVDDEPIGAPTQSPPDDPTHHPITDLANARRLIASHGNNLRFAPELGAWLVWNGHSFAEDLDGEVLRQAKRVIDDLREIVFTGTTAKAQSELLRQWRDAQRSSRVAGMLELAWSEPGVPVLVEQLDADPWLLNCENGTIDLHTGELRDHDRADRITKVCPAPYLPEAGAPTFRRFLGEVFAADRDLIGFVQRALGYSLTGDVSEQHLFLPYGTGANGKSTLLNCIRRVLGDYGVQLAPELLLVSKHDPHPTGLTDLRGARFAATIEVEQGRRLAEALVKMLTGGEHIRARRMRQDFFEFAPTHKLWLAVNHLPRVFGADDGIWRRILVIPFTERFDEDRRDSTLPEKIWAERAGVLAWLVEGCLAWQRDGLRPPDAVRMASDCYRAEQDHLGAFIDAACLQTPAGSVAARELRDAYERWAEQVGDEPLSKTMFGRLLTERGHPTDRGRRRRLGLTLAPQGQP